MCEPPNSFNTDSIDFYLEVSIALAICLLVMELFIVVKLYYGA